MSVALAPAVGRSDYPPYNLQSQGYSQWHLRACYSSPDNWYCFCFRMMSKEDLLAHFRDCTSLLESCHDGNLSKYLEQFKSFVRQLEEPQEQEPMDTGDNVETPLPAPAQETTSERKMRFQEVCQVGEKDCV